MKIKQKTLLEYVSPLLVERFGKNTALDKHELSPEAKSRAPKIDGEKPVWSIVTLGDQAFNYTVHSTGKTPQRALKCAGLEGWVKMLKSGQIRRVRWLVANIHCAVADLKTAFKKAEDALRELDEGAEDLVIEGDVSDLLDDVEKAIHFRPSNLTTNQLLTNNKQWNMKH